MEGDSQGYVLLNLFQHLFLKIVVDKTLKRVQGDDPLHRFQVHSAPLKMTKLLEITHYLALVNKKSAVSSFQDWRFTC